MLTFPCSSSVGVPNIKILLIKITETNNVAELLQFVPDGTGMMENLQWDWHHSKL